MIGAKTAGHPDETGLLTDKARGYNSGRRSWHRRASPSLSLTTKLRCHTSGHGSEPLSLARRRFPLSGRGPDSGARRRREGSALGSHPRPLVLRPQLRHHPSSPCCWLRPTGPACSSATSTSLPVRSWMWAAATRSLLAGLHIWAERALLWIRFQYYLRYTHRESRPGRGITPQALIPETDEDRRCLLILETLRTVPVFIGLWPAQARLPALQAAQQLATRLTVHKLVLLDPQGGLTASGTRLSFLNGAHLEELRSPGTGGELPPARHRQLETARLALAGGVASVSLCSPASLANELFTYEGGGDIVDPDRLLSGGTLGPGRFPRSRTAHPAGRTGRRAQKTDALRGRSVVAARLWGAPRAGARPRRGVCALALCHRQGRRNSRSLHPRTIPRRRDWQPLGGESDHGRAGPWPCVTRPGLPVGQVERRRLRARRVIPTGVVQNPCVPLRVPFEARRLGWETRVFQAWQPWLRRAAELGRPRCERPWARRNGRPFSTGLRAGAHDARGMRVPDLKCLDRADGAREARGMRGIVGGPWRAEEVGPPARARRRTGFTSLYCRLLIAPARARRRTAWAPGSTARPIAPRGAVRAAGLASGLPSPAALPCFGQRAPKLENTVIYHRARSARAGKEGGVITALSRGLSSLRSRRGGS